ncbi:MAG: ATP-binding protein, partial [Desulfosudaceae bacterium]
ANQGLCLPQGHLSLENALIVPVLHGSSLIGQFAVANKTGGYTENDRKLLELAAFQTAPILNAHLQAERQHQRREQLESQLRQAQKMESIGTLAGGIAHDFNNILSPVIGFTELSLERVAENTRLHRNLSEVLKGGLRAKELVKQILTMSRREEQEKMPVALTPLVKEALKMLRATIPASIEFKEDISRRDLIVNADPTQLHQIIMNLATNAVQAMRDQSGLLEVSVQPVQFDKDISKTSLDIRPGHYARLAVSDTGSGIPEKDRDKIFEPYFTTKKKEDGTGLGLAVVHGIVKSHHGHINFYSDPGQGTTFHVYLPLAESGSAARPARAVTPLPTGTETILLVDDELPIAEMLYQVLERRGYKVIIRTSSIEALEAFRFSPRRFDLVITDLTMPQMTGDKLAHAIKAIRPDIPIILCTGFSEKIRQLDDQNLPIDSFLMKPVDQISLTRTIRKLIDRTEV